MKKIFVPFLMLAAVSCTFEVAVEEPVRLEKEITITATSGELDTRTVREADGAVLWNPGDQISLFYGSGENGGSCFTAQNTETARVAQFTGTIGVITGGSEINFENTYFWAVYPYNAAASCDGNSITTVLPSSQVATADTFADDLFLTMGRSQGLSIAFYNICGGVKFTVSEEGIKRVTLKGNSGEQIAGTITVGFDENKLPKVTSIANGSDTIILNAPAGETFQVGKAYYFVIVPTVFENGFTLTFNKGDTWAVYERTQKATIRRSVFGTISAPDAGLQWNQMQYVSIPDENFRAYMIQNFDSNGDGELDELEAALVKRISVAGKSIASLVGLECCSNLEALYCSDNQLTSLDVSANTALTYLSCQNNQLTSLDVSGCSALATVYCKSNQLTSLGVSANYALAYLNCDDNQLTSLDVSVNTALQKLYCNNNQLTSLDVSAHQALQYLYCYGNQLTSLDLSGNTNLWTIECYNNQLTSLDVSGATNLRTLSCSSNQLTSLDVCANTALQSLSCGRNQLTSLDVSECDLEVLNCQSNPNLSVIWLFLGQAIDRIDYDSAITALKYKGIDYDTELPTEITNADEFVEWLIKADRGEYQITVSELDMTGKSIVPSIGFAGVLECNGCLIKNLQSNRSLFSCLQGTVKNLVLDSSCIFTITPGESGFIADTNMGTIDGCVNNANASYQGDFTEITYFGAIAGRSTGVVKNCVNNGNISFTVANGIASNHYIGGVIGRLSGTSGAVAVENCTNNGTVKITKENDRLKLYIGGVVGGSVVNTKGQGINEGNGLKDYGVVKGCMNTGEVSCIHNVNVRSAYPNVGGVIGYIEGSIENCTNKGAVTLRCSEDPAEDCLRPALGGVAGYVTKSAKDCINEGTVIARGVWGHGTEGAQGAAGSPFPLFGGVIGGVGEYYLATCPDGFISGCINKGALDIQVSPRIGGGPQDCGGGVVGYSSLPVIDDCHNEGELIIGLWGKIARFGGVVGYSYASSITNCTNTGALTFDCNSAALGANTSNHISYQDYVAGIIGVSSVSATISGCVNSGPITYKGGVTQEAFNYVGGIMGSYSKFQTMTNCTNSGKVNVDSAEALCVGSLCGAFNGVMTGCEATGDVVVKKCIGIIGKEPEIGTLVGYANASFEDCTANNSVAIEAAGPSFYGGIAGGFGKDVQVQWSGCEINSALTSSGSVTTAKMLGRFRNDPSDGTVIYYKDMTFGGDISSLGLVGIANGGEVTEGTKPE